MAVKHLCLAAFSLSPRRPLLQHCCSSLRLSIADETVVRRLNLVRKLFAEMARVRRRWEGASGRAVLAISNMGGIHLTQVVPYIL